MTTYTLSALLRTIEEGRTDLRRTDAVMHEINGKLGAPSAPRDLREPWSDVYREWSDFALSSPLLRDREPRVTSDDVKRARAGAAELKRRGLVLYARWKDRVQPRAAASSAVAGDHRPAPAPSVFGVKNGLLRGALVGAALLGGAAALKVLLDGWKKPAPAPAPTPGMVGGGPYGMAPMQFATLAPMLVPPVMTYPRASYDGMMSGDDE